ncbi:MAG: tetratricopeptide repeat protein [Pseudomonadota bacterium]|nr:tetratricopeptide repeat protein [Pseudomonadota bacterium]
MFALISGSSGKAAYINGINATLLDVSGNSEIRIATREAHSIFSNFSDTIKINQPNVKDVRKRLVIENSKSNSLLLFITLLDDDIEFEKRLPLASFLEDEIENSEYIYTYIRDIMCTRPIPHPISQCGFQGRVGSLLNALVEAQPTIKMLSSALTESFSKWGVGENSRKLLEGTVTNSGLFWKIISKTAKNSDLSKLQFELINKSKYLRINDCVHFIDELKNKFALHIDNKQTRKPKDLDFSKLKDVDANFENNLNKQYSVSNTKKTHTIYESVKKQIEAIDDLLWKENYSLARSRASELVAEQVDRNEKSFAALSLCSLSELAKRLNQFDLQLEWALQSTEMAPEDYRTYGHVADAYLNLGMFEEAHQFFTKCLEGQGDNRLYGFNGLARIEKNRHRFDEAIRLCDLAIEEGATDVIPHNLKAEIYRDQARLDEAEELYRKICKNFPDAPVAHCGLAATLADKRDFDASIAEYKNALYYFRNRQDQKIINSGLGFLLARLGDFKKAHKYIDTSIRHAQLHDIDIQITKIKALKIEGKLKNALTLALRIKNKRPQFPQLIAEIMSIYCELSQPEQALQVYHESASNISKDTSVKLSLIKTFKLLRNEKEALVIANEILEKEPKHILALLEKAHIFKVGGRLSDALRQYQKVLDINRFNKRAIFGKLTIQHLLGRYINLSKDNLAEEYEAPTTFEDHRYLGQLGILQAASGQAKLGKSMLETAIHAFPSLEVEFDVPTSLACLYLDQKSAAIRKLKKQKTEIGITQKFLVYGIQGRLANFSEEFSEFERNMESITLKQTIGKIRHKFLTAENDDCIGLTDLLSLQMNNYLRAA